MTIRSEYFGFLALWLPLAAPVARAETSEAEQIQAALESWVLERAPAEKKSRAWPLTSASAIPARRSRRSPAKLDAIRRIRQCGRPRCSRWAAHRNPSPPP